MKHDYNKRQPRAELLRDAARRGRLRGLGRPVRRWIFPRLSGPKNDVVLDMLNKIQCLTPDGAGGETRTQLALSMHTMRGARGDYLASAIREKWAQGCDFRVSYGLIGFKTKQILGAATARGRIPLRSTGLDYHPDDDFDLNNDGEDDVILDYYSHQKYLVIQGTYNGVPGTDMVLTGSSNWASLGTANDELWFTVQGRTWRGSTCANFDSSGTTPGNSRDAYTTTYTDVPGRPDARGPTGTMRGRTPRSAPTGHHGRARPPTARAPTGKLGPTVAAAAGERAGDRRSVGSTRMMGRCCTDIPS